MDQDFFERPPFKNASERLRQQIDFILEMDKLKRVLRRSMLLDQSRNENDAEHSWHLAILAMILSEYASPEVDINRVVRMLLIHDIVEIDAGDTFVYDESAVADTKAERENAAANRIFSLLPEDLKEELISLWREFEARSTPDAKFAAGLDRLQPLLLNYFSDGGTWSKHHVPAGKVRAKQRVIAEASQPLWNFVESLISDAVERKILNE